MYNFETLNWVYFAEEFSASKPASWDELNNKNKLNLASVSQNNCCKIFT